MTTTVTQHNDRTPDPGEPRVPLPRDAARVRAHHLTVAAELAVRALQAAELQQLAMQP
jgi:hypothetical protein